MPVPASASDHHQQRDHARTLYVRSVLAVLALIAVAVAILSSTAAAQVQAGQVRHRVSPPAFAAIENQEPFGYAFLFGGYPEQRFMLADAECSGRAETVIGIEFRADRSPGFASAGRRWTHVSASLGELDGITQELAFAAHRSANQARIWSGAVAWAAAAVHDSQSAPATNATPGSFGAGGLHFPASAPFVLQGRSQLVLEFEFRGGSLDNAATWPIDTLVSYYLEGTSSREHALAPTSRLPAPCVNGVVDLRLLTHADTAWANAGMITHHQTTHRLPAGALVVTAIGLQELSGGLAIDAACNRLWMIPALWHSHSSDALGTATTSFGSVRYHHSLRGLPVLGQSAFATNDGRVQLTPAVRATIEAPPPPAPRQTLMLATSNEPTPLAQEQGSIVGRAHVPVFRLGVR